MEISVTDITCRDDGDSENTTKPGYKPEARRSMAHSVDKVVEDAISMVGGMGRFQMMVIALVTGAKLPFAPAMLLMSFGGKIPDWWCVDELSDDDVGNLTSDSPYYQKCSINGTSCTRKLFGDDMRTIASEYDLVCDKKMLAGVITSIQLAGLFVGGMVTGQIAELIGRKKTVYLLIFSNIVFCAISLIVIDWKYFAFARFLIGFGVAGINVVDISVPVEFTSPKWRPYIAGTPSWALGASFFSLAAYLLHDWKYITVATIVITIPFMFGWFVVPESMRWLITRGRVNEAKSVLRKIAKMNRKPDPDLSLIDDVTKISRAEVTEKKYSYLDMVRTVSMAKKTIPCIIIWFTVGFGYYGIIFGVVALSGDFYVNLFLITMVDLPRSIVIIALSNVIGRKGTLFITLVVSCLATMAIVLVSYVVHDEDTRASAISGLAMTCKFGLGTAWLVIKLHTSEVFPTVVRNMSLGLGGAAARVGSMISPQLIYLDQLNGSMMYFVIGLFTLLSIAVTATLSETMGEPLPDFIGVVDKSVSELEDCKTDGENHDTNATSFVLKDDCCQLKTNMTTK